MVHLLPPRINDFCTARAALPHAGNFASEQGQTCLCFQRLAAKNPRIA
jgi:hypothetical protein